MSTPSADTDSSPTLHQVLAPIWVERKRILVISLAVGVVTLGINFLLPKSYKATAVLLPETDKSKLGMMSQYAGLASLAGVNVSGGDLARLFPAILSSESILRNVISRRYRSERFKDSVNLIQYFEFDDAISEKNMDDAIRQMKGALITSFDSKTSIVTISLELREPQLTADILNAAIGELDSFLREKKMNSASEQRKWVETRLVQVDGELHAAEERVKDFRERNRRVIDSPLLLLQQDRLLREVQIKGTIEIELRKQAEIAKIEEIKQVTTINVLDEGRAPVRKEHPKRATNAVLATIIVFSLLSGYFVTKSLYGGRIERFVNELRS